MTHFPVSQPHGSPGVQVSPQGGDGGSELRLRIANFRRVIKRNLIGIVGFALVGAIVGLIKALSAVPIYSASVTMLVEPSPPRMTIGSEGFIPYSNPYLFYETQFDIIRSRVMAERVVEKMRLVDRPNAGRVQHPSVLKALLTRLGLQEKLELGATTKESVSVSSQANIPLSTEEREQRAFYLANSIRGGVSVSGGERSQILSVNYESPDPEFAAEVANAVADAYIDLGMDTRLQKTRQATAWLTERLESLRKKVSESEATLQAFQKKEGMVDLESLSKLISGRLETLNREVLAAQARYSELAKRYGEKHPALIAAKAELQTAMSRLQQESGTVVATKQTQFELAKLEREVATNRELYNTFLTQFKQIDVADDQGLTNVRIMDRATIPTAPYKPNKRKILMMYLLFGLALGLGLAVLRDYLDNTFKTTDDVETKLGIPALGVVPIVQGSGSKSKALPERHYLTDSRSSFAEAVNHVRTGVLFSHIDNPPKTILVTSSIQSEGKTTLSTNLAIAFSQLGPTLLVDADLRKPRVAAVSGLQRDRGLVEVIAGQMALKDCIIKDQETRNLYILKSGTIPPNPLEILSSERFHSLIAELKEKFEHVVIDSAPLLPVSDALVAGQIVDGLILVIQSERTTHVMAQEALKRLRATKINPLGVVLSQVSQRRGSAYYKDSYYYSTYYYGHKGGTG